MVAEVDISICIANYNGSGILRNCLVSIINQQTQAKLEIIVFDDASTDGSLDAELQGFTDILIIRSEVNVGYCSANARMVDRATGRYLLLLNNDIELMQGALETLFCATKHGPERILSLAEYTIDGRLSCRGMGLDIFFTPFQCRSNRHKVVYAMGACLMIRRQIWLDIGGYPEFFVYTGEDLYLCLRAKALGVETRILDGSGYRHHISKSTNANGINIERRALSERNRLYIIRNLLRIHERLFVWPLFKFMSILEKVYLAIVFRTLGAFCVDSLQPQNENVRVSIGPSLTWRATKVLYLFGR